MLDLRQLSWTGNPKFGIDYEACTKTEGCSRKCPMGQKHVGMCVVNGKALKPDKMHTDEPKWLHDAGLAVAVVVRTLRSKKPDEPPKKQVSFDKALPVTAKMLRATAVLLVLVQIDASRMRGDNDSSPWGTATNERTMDLFNISHAPVVSLEVPTCSGFYIDLGTNIGVQVRKLFEPGRYPGAAIAAKFDKLFGARRGQVCAIGFEPNPLHWQRLRRLETEMMSVGKTFRYVSAAAGVGQGLMGFDQPGAGIGWDLSGKSHKQARTQRLPEVLVPQLGVSYMLNSVVSRYARSQRVPTLIKLDVEDSKLEEGIISDLVGSGILCRLVDEIVWENHNVSEVMAGRKFAINPKTVVGQAVDKIKSTPGCRTKITPFDDESYSLDFVPNDVEDWARCPPTTGGLNCVDCVGNWAYCEDCRAIWNCSCVSACSAGSELDSTTRAMAPNMLIRRVRRWKRHLESTSTVKSLKE